MKKIIKKHFVLSKETYGGNTKYWVRNTKNDSIKVFDDLEKAKLNLRKKTTKKRKEYGYDINDPFDRSMVLDLPFSQLNKRGRKAKKKNMFDL